MNEVSELLNSVYGLPGDIILGLFAITVGYVLRLPAWFEDRHIPLVVVSLCMVGSPVMAIGTYQGNMIPEVLTHVMVGAVVGLAAWLVHNKILARIEERIPILGGLLSSVKEDKPGP